MLRMGRSVLVTDLKKMKVRNGHSFGERAVWLTYSPTHSTPPFLLFPRLCFPFPPTFKRAHVRMNTLVTPALFSFFSFSFSFFFKCKKKAARLSTALLLIRAGGGLQPAAQMALPRSGQPQRQAPTLTTTTLPLAGMADRCGCSQAIAITSILSPFRHPAPWLLPAAQTTTSNCGTPKTAVAWQRSRCTTGQSIQSRFRQRAPSSPLVRLTTR